MTIDELLIKIGVDATQASKINAVINQLNNGANKIGQQANQINNSLNQSINSVKESVSNVSNSTDKANSSVSKLRLGLLAVVAGATLVARGLVSVFNRAIDSTAKLYMRRHALFKISREELIQARQYKLAMDKLGLAIDSIKNKIALNLAPEVTKLVGAFNKWMVVNKDLIANGITKIIQIVGKVIQVFVNLFRFIDKLISNTIGWKNAIIALGVAWAVFNRALLFSPIGIVIGLITALMLLIDDLMVYVDGGKSLFGEYWQPLIDGTQKVVKVAKTFWREWKALAVGILTYIGLILATGLVSKIVVGFLKIGKAFKALQVIFMSNPIIAAISLIAMLSYYVYENWDWLSTWFANFWDNITNLFSNAITKILTYFGMSEDDAKKTTTAIANAFGLLVDLIIAPFKAAYNLVVGLFDIWSDDTSSFIDKITNSFSLVKEAVIAPFRDAVAWVKDKFLGAIEGAINKVKGWLSYIGIDLDDNTSASEFDEKFNAKSVSQVSKSNISNSKKVVNQGDITNNINITTSDTGVAANQVADTLTRQIENASNNAVGAMGR